MRILLVSQMYPGPEDPDLGIFVAQIAEEHERQGHVVERAVLDRRGGSRAKYPRLGVDALRRARRFRPDVVFGHFLFPTGLAAAGAAAAVRAPLVLMAHGTDVANVGRIPGVRAATRLATSRARVVIANSRYLRDELLGKLPALAGRVEVIDCGVDLERFHGRDPASARRELGWDADGPRFLIVGSLIERKNVARLAEAVERLGRGELAVVGDGPLRAELEGRPRLRLVGRVAPERVPDWIAASDVVCQPSLEEAFGQAVLEAMASERSVVATKVGGPPELVTPQAGAIVDPLSVDSIERGLRTAAELPCPNPAARAAAEPHDVRTQAGRMASVLERAMESR